MNYTYDSGVVEGYINFIKPQELKNSKFFMIYYNELSNKYKNLIDSYLQTVEYRSLNLNRGYRSKEKTFDIKTIQEFYAYDKLDFKVLDFLKGKEYFEYSYGQYHLFELIACEIRENPKVLEHFKAIVYDNENVQNLSTDLIKGAIVSDNKEAIKAVFDLLKAAKLSEGLRSSIVN